jgi:hypothetical protein
MTVTDIIEHEDNTTTLVLDMTKEELTALLTSAIVRALHLGLQEQKDIEAEYKK